MPVVVSRAFLIAECKQCYQYHMSAGETCRTKALTEACWSAAKRGFCSMESALVYSYNMTTNAVRKGACKAAVLLCVPSKTTCLGASGRGRPIQ